MIQASTSCGGRAGQGALVAAVHAVLGEVVEGQLEALRLAQGALLGGPVGSTTASKTARPTFFGYKWA